MKAVSNNEKFEIVMIRPLPAKPKSTAEWLAYISIDMHMKGYSLKDIGRKIDGLPKEIAAMRKKESKGRKVKK